MRNVFASAFGVDLSMNNAGHPVIKTSIYQVEDIDTNCEPFEISLREISCGLVVIVDISESDVDRLKESSIQEGSIVATSLMSVPNDLHITASWRLLGGVKKVG